MSSKKEDLKADAKAAADDLRDGAEKLRDEAADALSDAAGTARRTAAKLQDTAKDAISEGRDTAEGIAARVAGYAQHAAEGLKSGAARGSDLAQDALAGTREALAATGEKVAATLRSATDHADLKSVQDSVTHAVTATAEALRDTRISDVAGDLRDSAKRNPGLFILGAAVAGFAIGCWMQSSATRTRSDEIIRKLRS